jgi:hypothetical protein
MPLQNEDDETPGKAEAKWAAVKNLVQGIRAAEQEAWGGVTDWILARQRHGKLTSEGQKILDSARDLPRVKEALRILASIDAAKSTDAHRHETQ